MKCAHLDCDLDEWEHHDFKPWPCKCDRDTWVREPPTVCVAFEVSAMPHDFGRCKNCGHDKGCHATASPDAPVTP